MAGLVKDFPVSRFTLMLYYYIQGRRRLVTDHSLLFSYIPSPTSYKNGI
jgi:hypothetical protein